MSLIAIFAIVFVIGLVGSIYAYAQPSASSWCVAFVFMFVVGALGFVVSLVLSLIRLIKGG